MTDKEIALWHAAQRRAAQLSPAIGLAILQAFALLRAYVSDDDVEHALRTNTLEVLLNRIFATAVLAGAFLPVRDAVRRSVNDGARYAVRQIPVPLKAGRTLTVAFDTLHPRVITAVRTLESKVITDLTDGMRDMLRAYAENGLRNGVNPRVLARDLRALIGVPPSREVWIANYEAALGQAHLSGRALAYELRDKRFDATLAAARRTGTALTREQIATMTAGMRRKTIAYSANVVARTAALDALKLGQRLSWEAAAEQGIVDRSRVRRRWAGVMDTRERPEHVQMEADDVALDEPHRNGEMIPGESTYNCRCIDVFYVAAA